MAAAYAALLSVFHTLNHIKIHPRPPISLDQTQVDSLTEKLSFFQDFLERYPSVDEEELESRISAAAYAAEDVIETHIVDQIHAQSNIAAVEFPQGGRREKGDLMKKKGMKLMGLRHSGSTSDCSENIPSSADLNKRSILLSLLHTLNHIKQHPISLDQNQNQVESLTKNITFLLHFLDSQENDDLERYITAAASAVEDVVDQIHTESNITTVHEFPQGQGRVRDSMGVHSDLYGDLGRAIQDMDLIKMTIQQKLMMMITPQDADLHTNSSVAASTWQSSTTPVFDDSIIIQLLDNLVGQLSALHIIPIVGMGGIGKTTLAKYIYEKPLTLQHFDILAWITFSQEYTRRNILQLLCQEVKGRIDDLSEMSEDEIGLVLYQHLCGRRYFIVLDDIWSVEAWYMIKSYLPDDNNGSRIMITTRLSNLALELSGGHDFQMQFLDEDKSWDLLCKTVFDKLDCPFELENVGKEIARKCRGLPLSIGVIGGLLKKSNMTQKYWMNTLENLSFTINLENDEYTLRILRTSYRELPIHLKPCFLYMGIFPEDEEIRTSMLIRLWVAEGILRPNDDKSLEEVAKEYLKELIDRNLVLVSKLRWNGEAKLCKIHDLLRDVCLREAQKQKFFCMLRHQKDYIPQDINMERRICINPEEAVKEYSPEFLVAVESASLTRSFLHTTKAYSSVFEASPSLRFRLLRVYSPVHEYKSFLDSNNAIFEQANLRYLSMQLSNLDAESRIVYLCSLLWNLQILKSNSIFEIWKMPLLRHVEFSSEAVLPYPPNEKDNLVLENLQTLSGIINFSFSEEVVKRIPNVKKLKLRYVGAELEDFGLHNLGRLEKLEDLNLLSGVKVRRNLVSFPHSLKKLTLICTKLSWEELTIWIGSLPLLQYLRLDYKACRGAKWETVEGYFCSLKLLKIHKCCHLKYWDTDCTHFPRLEYLYLSGLPNLKEIPLNIGDIPTLKHIQISSCNKSALDSAERIKEEQEENGNEDLQVQIYGAIYHSEEEEEEEEREREGEEDSFSDDEEEEEEEEEETSDEDS